MLKIAACQFTAIENVSKNLETATKLIQMASKKSADLVVLPEIFCSVPYHFDELKKSAEVYKAGPIQQHFSSLAKELNIWIAAGSLPLKADQAGLTNTALVFDNCGKEVCRYDKVHLFSFDGSCEADIYTQGKSAGVFELTKKEETFRIGLAICFDIRFPGMFSEMNHPDLILIPAAFTKITGQAHWETLLRARAIENQCYLCASDQAAPLWGHSMIIDPWGKILEKLGDSENDFIVSAIDKNLVNEVRTRIPMF